MTDGIDYALPLQRTHLSLPYYARLMGINPVNFAGGAGTTVWTAGGCSDLWPRYSYQANDRASHEELANAIYDAERDLARILGYTVAPEWFEQEVHDYPRPHRPDAYNINMKNRRGQFKSFKLNWGYFIQGGTRLATNRRTVSPSYTDESGDGFIDTATITSTSTATDVAEEKVYFLGTGGDPDWEIRPCRTKSISAGVLTMTFDPWLFIDPDHYSYTTRPPTPGGFSAFDLENSYADYYVTEVDIYWEYNDYTQPGVVFYWESQPDTIATCEACGGTGCPVCFFTSQNGCLHARDSILGMVAAAPAEYDSANQLWYDEQMAVGRDPDEIKAYYYAGHQSQNYLAGRTYDPLDRYLAQAIAWVATARLERDICSCGNLAALSEDLRRDLSVTSENQGDSRFTPDEILTNPIGMRKGEVMAWQRIKNMVPSIAMGAAL